MGTRAQWAATPGERARSSTHAGNPTAALAGGRDNDCRSRAPARAAGGSRLARRAPAARGGRGSNDLRAR
eukprot:3740023-Alexandrium_andersonii.AAC.1